MRVIISCALAGVLATTQPAVAGEETEDVALLAYLGLDAASGKTTLAEGAGALEGFILTSRMLDQAGGEISRQVARKLGSDVKRVVPLADDQKLSLSAYSYVLTRFASLDATLADVRRRNQCRGGTRPLAPRRDRSAKPDLTAADLIGALKTDTDIRPYTVAPSAQLVINAITAHRIDRVDWSVPDEIALISGPSTLLNTYSRILTEANALSDAACNEAIGGEADAIGAAARGLAAPGDGGKPSLLEQAMLSEGLVESGGQTRVLRVNVAKAGGSLINRSNIWTTLGANGVTMTGGMVITYRLVDPETGQLLLSEALVCSHPARSLGSIARDGGRNSKGGCQPIGRMP